MAALQSPRCPLQLLQLLAVEDDRRLQVSKLEAEARDAALERDRARKESEAMRVQMEQEASFALETLKTMRTLEQVICGAAARLCARNRCM